MSIARRIFEASNTPTSWEREMPALGSEPIR